MLQVRLQEETDSFKILEHNFSNLTRSLKEKYES